MYKQKLFMTFILKHAIQKIPLDLGPVNEEEVSRPAALNIVILHSFIK